MRKETSNAPSVNPPFSSPYATSFTSNEFTPLPLHDNPYDPQDSVLHFPFLPPDYSSLLPFVDTHSASFFHELESLASNKVLSCGGVGGCSTKACVNCSNGDNKDSMSVNDNTSSWKVGGGDLSISWPSVASMRKGLRSKRRSPRKNCRRFPRLTRKKFLALSSVRPYRIAATALKRTRLGPQLPIVNEKLKLLLRKELKNSDVSSLGRVIIPKKDAEAHLPPLASKEGIRIRIKDMDSSETWNMKYSFMEPIEYISRIEFNQVDLNTYWPNNKSRMYVLQNARDFIRMYRLKTGDYMLLYLDEETGEYLISARKAQNCIVGYVSNKGDQSNTEKVFFGGTSGTSMHNSEHDSGGDIGGGGRCNSNHGGGDGGDTEIVIKTSIIKEGVADGSTIDVVGGRTSDISITRIRECQISSLEGFDNINDFDLSFCDDVLKGTPTNDSE